jgi:LacI family transcriptional regulator
MAMMDSIMKAENGAARRPTIADLAREAGVSVATVDRVLNRRNPVREATAARVLAAAEQLGYYATALLRSRLQPAEVKRTLGFLLQRGSSPFYRALAAELESVVHSAPDIQGRSVVEFADELTPTRAVERMRALGSRVDALAVVSVDHPRVTEEIERLRAAGVPTFALLSDLSAPSRAGYVGLDARKAGRTAAWAITRLSRRPGKVAIFVGSLRYLDHDLREMSLKTYLRELAPDFRLLEPVVDLEDEAVAYGAASDLLKRNPDLVGIYSAGGGTDGIAQALREEGAAGRIVFVCNELTPASRSGLIDGVIDLAIATPVPLLARRAVEAMLDAVGENRPASVLQLHVPLEVVTPESL